MNESKSTKSTEPTVDSNAKKIRELIAVISADQDTRDEMIAVVLAHKRIINATTIHISIWKQALQRAATHMSMGIEVDISTMMLGLIKPFEDPEKIYKRSPTASPLRQTRSMSYIRLPENKR